MIAASPDCTPGRSRRQLLGSYVTGVAVGAAALLGLVVAIRWGLSVMLDARPTPWLGRVTGVVAMVFAARELAGVRTRVPTFGWLVPRHFMLAGERMASFIFGAALGGGVVTRQRSMAFYVGVVLSLLATSWEVSGLAVTAYALSRVAPVYHASLNDQAGGAVHREQCCVQVIALSRRSAPLREGLVLAVALAMASGLLAAPAG